MEDYERLFEVTMSNKRYGKQPWEKFFSVRGTLQTPKTGIKMDRTVGCLPMKVPTCALFLRRGGSISCTVTGTRGYLADLASTDLSQV